MAGIASKSQLRMSFLRYALRSEEHTSELQSPCNIVCRLLLEKKKTGDLLSDTNADLRAHVASVLHPAIRRRATGADRSPCTRQPPLEALPAEVEIAVLPLPVS